MPAQPWGHSHVPSYWLHSAYCPQLKRGRRQLKLHRTKKLASADGKMEESYVGGQDVPRWTVLGPIVHQS